MASLPAQRPPARSVFVVGANGYIGAAVVRAFVRAGWRVFGLVRRAESGVAIVAEEATPIVGTLDKPDGWLPGLFRQTRAVDVVVNCIEPFPNYEEPFRQVIALTRRLAEESQRHGVRPLLLWCSGSKDYGPTRLHGDPALVPATEETALQNAIDAVRRRTDMSLEALAELRDAVDAVLLRPPTVYGYTSGYYGPLLDYAAAERAAGARALRVRGDPNAIMHAMHIDDCGEGFVALAEHRDRAALAGQSFNLASYRYETAREVADAVAAEYGFPDGADVSLETRPGPSMSGFVDLGFNLSQWVGSDKIRQLTGWTDRRLPFSENLAVYRAAYDAAQGHENVALVKNRIASLSSALK
jgi:nucleoside-diphosphate-sugar epimerase